MDASSSSSRRSSRYYSPSISPSRENETLREDAGPRASDYNRSRASSYASAADHIDDQERVRSTASSPRGRGGGTETIRDDAARLASDYTRSRRSSYASAADHIDDQDRVRSTASSPRGRGQFRHGSVSPGHSRSGSGTGTYLTPEAIADAEWRPFRTVSASRSGSHFRPALEVEITVEDCDGDEGRYVLRGSSDEEQGPLGGFEAPQRNLEEAEKEVRFDAHRAAWDAPTNRKFQTSGSEVRCFSFLPKDKKGTMISEILRSWISESGLRGVGEGSVLNLDVGENRLLFTCPDGNMDIYEWKSSPQDEGKVLDDSIHEEIRGSVGIGSGIWLASRRRDGDYLLQARWDTPGEAFNARIGDDSDTRPTWITTLMGHTDFEVRARDEEHVVSLEQNHIKIAREFADSWVIE